MWAIHKLCPYLKPRGFTVSADDTSLRWLLNLKGAPGRLARRAIQLQAYDYKLLRRRDVSARIPTTLAQEPLPDDRPIEDTFAIDPGDPDIRCSTDMWYRKRLAQVTRYPDHNPDWAIRNQKLYFHRPNLLFDDVLPDVEAWKLVVPREWRNRVFVENHDLPQAGHLGVQKTYHRVTEKYYWPNLFRDVTVYVRSCDIC